MDSCVTAAIANEENAELAFLHVSYGQRTETRERESFEKLADHYRVKSRLVVSLEQLARIGGSSLTDTRIPVSQARSFGARDTVELRSFQKCSSAVCGGELGGSAESEQRLHRRGG